MRSEVDQIVDLHRQPGVQRDVAGDADDDRLRAVVEVRRAGECGIVLLAAEEMQHERGVAAAGRDSGG